MYLSNRDLTDIYICLLSLKPLLSHSHSFKMAEKGGRSQLKEDNEKKQKIQIF